MIVLVYPMWSNQNVNADSNYVFLKSLLKKIIEIDRSYLFFVVMNKNLRYYEDGFFDNRNIIKINASLPTSKREMVVHFDMNFWHKVKSLIPIDIVFNNVPEVGNLFKSFRSRPDRIAEIQVVNQHHYIIHPTLFEYDQLEYIRNMQIINSVMAFNVFNSNYCQKMFDEEQQKLLKDDVKINKQIIKMGLVSEEMLTLQQPKYSQPTFIYNHRLNNYKNWQETFNIFDKLYNEGLDFKVVFTGGNSDKTSTILKKSYVVLKSFVKHDDYLKEVSKCHFNTLNSRHETFCISILESMLFGLDCICPNRLTFPELLGDNNWQMFKTIDQQYNLLKQIIKNPTFNKNNQERALKVFNKNDYAEKYLLLFESFKPKEKILHNLKIKKNIKKIDQYLKVNKKFTFKQFKAFVFSLGYSDQSFFNLKIKTILNQEGFLESWEKNEIYFTRT